jgi:exodeoxyribonuclease VII large subunit
MLRPAGAGLLHMRFEELKARLHAEGLFDPSRKRELPALPRRIGLVTSPTGAALRDILNVLSRRYPLAEVLLAGCQVQGDGAADTIVEALFALYEQNVDAIIVARGGGSIEDLWAFNEEIVARAVFASPVPVISGVGHETDTTIIDYVADLRAPTPSAAAELVAPDIAALEGDLAALTIQLGQVMRRSVERARADLSEQRSRLAQRSPAARLARDRQSLDDLLRRAGAQFAHNVALRHARLEGARAQLAALTPLATLDRGYAIVRRAADGQVVTAPGQAEPHERLEITVKGGSFGATRTGEEPEHKSVKRKTK